MVRDELQDFDPANPTVILFTSPGGNTLTPAERGDCVDEEWTGPDDYQVVGAVFLVPATDEHPEGFAGPFDNWHAHFNVCHSRSNFRGRVTAERCAAQGGVFLEEDPR